MSGFESRLERLELKYLVDEATAAAVRADLAPFCKADAHNRRAENRRAENRRAARGARDETAFGRIGYEIASLYLDSPGLAFHEAKERGDAERLKLRVRTYSPASPAVLELKKRVSDTIDKTRTAVDRKDVEGAARGLPGTEHLGYDERRFLDRFARIVAESGAEPTLHVRYEREAYVSVVDHYARVTFDRHIRAARAASWDLDAPDAQWCRFDDSWRNASDRGRVVLEIKCQSFIPLWVLDLVRRHGLKRQSFSKYSIGIHLTGRAQGEERMARRSARWVA